MKLKRKEPNKRFRLTFKHISRDWKSNAKKNLHKWVTLCLTVHKLTKRYLTKLRYFAHQNYNFALTRKWLGIYSLIGYSSHKSWIFSIVTRVTDSSQHFILMTRNMTLILFLISFFRVTNQLTLDSWFILSCILNI